MAGSSGEQWRVEFDANVVFSNGGGLRAREFRLDIPGADIADAEAGELFVRHLGLLMVGEVKISNKRLIREPHKGSRGVPVAGGGRDVVELPEAVMTYAGAVPRLSALVDLPVTLVRTLGAGSGEIGRSQLAPFEVTGTAVVLHSGGGAGLGEDAAAWLADRAPAVVVTDGGGPANGLLTSAGIPVVSAATGLADLPATGTRLHVVPLDPARNPCPVRAYAVAAS
ncbi:hypothetical protein EDD29_0416 [Actinocorallia herbida]|uniref:Cyclase n=1 Tax=Actinocorallia herbida TaxID=58109 RepID=A0A3N1CNN9_9ACTN|nr:hypothetical protein [Actinocorallia herbida]ROO82930.1 hypothetical protein EDD29_0416 [Actinocorallia herbida]